MDYMDICSMCKFCSFPIFPHIFELIHNNKSRNGIGRLNFIIINKGSSTKSDFLYSASKNKCQFYT